MVVNIGVNVNKVVNTGVNKKEEMKMVNNTNNKVNGNEVATNGVNKKEEMKMVNNNNGVKKEWVERIEVYVNVKNGRTLESLIEDGTLADGSYQRLGLGPDENLEDVQVGDGWVVSIDKVNNLEIIGNPDIKKGLRVYVMEHGNIIEKTLYLSVDEDGVIGNEDVIYELRSEEDVASAAINKAGLFVSEWMSYFNVNNSGIDFDRLVKCYKRYTSGKNSYDTIYSETVERFMRQIKSQREMEARLDKDRVYDVDWEFGYLDYCDVEEAKVADDLNSNHEYYGIMYLSVDDYEYYKELDEAYLLVEDFKEHPGRYVIYERYSSDEWQEEFEYHKKEIYMEFMESYGNAEEVEVLARRLQKGWYSKELVRIMRRVLSSYMYSNPSEYVHYPISTVENADGAYITMTYKDIKATIQVADVNYTTHDKMRVVVQITNILDAYKTEMVRGYEYHLINVIKY